MDKFGIQLSVKLPANEGQDSSMVNLRGDNPPEFEELADWVAENPEVFLRVHNALRGVPRTTAEAVANIQAAMPGATVVGEYNAGYPPAPPSAVATGGYCNRCKKAPTCPTCDLPCKPMKSIKDGKWFVHDCPTGDRAHKGVWCYEPK